MQALKDNLWKIILGVIVIVGIFCAGIFTGRKTVSTEIKYLPGETVRDTMLLPSPSEERPPVDTLDIINQCIRDGIYAELWPERVDTLIINDTITIVPDLSDTLAILADWATYRAYSDTLFSNDTSGHFDYNAVVQYNRMTFFSYNYTPVHRETTKFKDGSKIVSPFVGMACMVNFGENKNPMLQFNAGVYIREKYGIYAIYQRGLTLNNDYLGAGISYKF